MLNKKLSLSIPIKKIIKFDAVPSDEKSSPLKSNRQILINNDKIQLNCKLTCQCSVCQHPKMIPISVPELFLDSFITESDDDFEDKSLIKKSYSTNSKKMGQSTIMENDLEKDFLFILKRLLPTKGLHVGLKLLIPDTIVYFGGEPKFILFNGKDDYLATIKNKDKLTPNEIKKFFQDRRRKKETDLLLLQESILLSMIGSESPNNSARNSLKKKSQIRFSVLPEEITSDLVDGVELRKLQERLKMRRFNDNSNSTSNEFALVKYKDNNIQIVSEMDFTYLVAKRRIEKDLNDVVYIQSFMRPKKGLSNLLHIKYLYENEKNKDLFRKALEEISIISNYNIHTEKGEINYIEQEHIRFENELKSSNLNQYAMYLTYKIAHYIEAFHSIKILKCRTEFMKDEFNNIWLMNISYLKSIDVNKIKKNDNILKKINLIDQEEKNKIISHLDDFYNKASVNKKAFINEIIKKMKNNYEQAKIDLGIDLNAKTPEDSFTDDVFKNLNQQNKYPLSKLLSNKLEDPKMKAHILNNFPDVQRKFLQNFEEKRPISANLHQKIIVPTKFAANYRAKLTNHEKFLQICRNKTYKKNEQISEYHNLLSVDSSNKPFQLKTNFNRGVPTIKKDINFFHKYDKQKQLPPSITKKPIKLSAYSLRNLNNALPTLLYS